MSKFYLSPALLAVALFLACLFHMDPQGACAAPVTAKKVLVAVTSDADETDQRIAGVLKERIERRTAATVVLGQAPDASADLVVYLGTWIRNSKLDKLCTVAGAKLPGRKAPAPEGFALKTATVDSHPSVLAVGADHRGTLYAAGELLRRMRYAEDSVALDPVDLSTAPAYRFRGFSANQGGTMLEVTGARPWKLQEREDYMLDLALAGANCFYVSGATIGFVKSFDMLVETGCRPNELPNPPKEWRGTEIGNWVCPSIPEAHAALLKHWEVEFAKRKNYDILRFFAGDPGGCRCEKCRPWGKTFIHLCEEIAEIWLKMYPGTVVLAANQDLDNAGDQAIFDYLNEAPRSWLYGLAYGPGSNAMSDYFRGEQRDDLFTYPGGGPVNRYLAETLRELPRQQHIVHYSDITHWISAQYQVEHPDPYIQAFYGRRMFHARPKAYNQIFQSIMPFSEGDIIYSEGYHDEFHQYMWNRLLWNPSMSLNDVTLEYCRYFFGEDAAEPMKEALFQLEENLELPLADNKGIDRYYELVSEAGKRMPPNLMAGNYRWRLHMQKAALDKYLQDKLRRAFDQQERIQQAAGAAGKKPDDALRAIRAMLDEPKENEEMTQLRDAAGRLGEETNDLFGVRDVGYFSLDRPLRVTANLTRLTDEADAAKSKKEKQKILAEMAAFRLSDKLGPVLKK